MRDSAWALCLAQSLGSERMNDESKTPDALNLTWSQFPPTSIPHLFASLHITTPAQPSTIWNSSINPSTMYNSYESVEEVVIDEFNCVINVVRTNEQWLQHPCCVDFNLLPISQTTSPPTHPIPTNPLPQSLSHLMAWFELVRSCVIACRTTMVDEMVGEELIVKKE